MINLDNTDEIIRRAMDKNNNYAGGERAGWLQNVKMLRQRNGCFNDEIIRKLRERYRQKFPEAQPKK